MAQKISRNFSFIGKNIKKIRQAKNISQSEFATLFNLARPSVGAYEEERSEPKIETIITIANHFNLSIDLLLNRELSSADILSIGILNKKLDAAHSGKIESSSSAPFVSIKDRVEYIVHSKNNSFIESLPHLSTNKSSIARVFEHEGIEMEVDKKGLSHGDLLYCIPSTHKKNKITVVALKEKIIIRRLSEANETYKLEADNPNYEMLEFSRDEVIECWEVVGIYSENLTKPSELESRVALIEKKLGLSTMD